MPLHLPCCHGPPNSPPEIGSNDGQQIAAPARLTENCPSSLSNATTPGSYNPGWIAVLINNFFHFFWLYTMPRDVPNIVIVPRRRQFPESHKLNLAQETTGFESLYGARDWPPGMSVQWLKGILSDG